MVANKKWQSQNTSDAIDADEIILIDDDDEAEDDDSVETCAADKCLKFVGKLLSSLMQLKGIWSLNSAVEIP